MYGPKRGFALSLPLPLLHRYVILSKPLLRRHSTLMVTSVSYVVASVCMAFTGMVVSQLPNVAAFMCRNECGLNITGLMCIPPFNIDPVSYFVEMNKLNKDLGFTELSMGMSSDYLTAAEYLSTYIRVGSSIFGQRS